MVDDEHDSGFFNWQELNRGFPFPVPPEKEALVQDSQSCVEIFEFVISI